MQIERGEDWNAFADDSTNSREQRAVRIGFHRRNRGAMQRKKHSVERPL